MPGLENAVSRLIDEAAVRDAVAGFAEAASFKQYDAFRTLWADDGVWTIGAPYEARVEGPEAIVGLLQKLRDPKEFFLQYANPGAIIVDGDTAHTRCIVHEEGRGSDAGFRCHSVTDDVLRRAGDRWVFVSRAFQYIWLDTNHFPGDAFTVSPLAPLPHAA